MEDIQNAVLAGGVAVGSSADLVIGPYASLIVGAIAGIVSVMGYKYISPFLQEKLDIHDTCGVHNLHGMPGILGGIVSAIAIAAASTDTYEKDAFDKSFGAQAAFQLLGVAITLAVAIVGGWITGRILRFVICFVL